MQVATANVSNLLFVDAGDRIERLKLLPLHPLLCGIVSKISNSLHVAIGKCSCLLYCAYLLRQRVCPSVTTGIVCIVSKRLNLS